MTAQAIRPVEAQNQEDGFAKEAKRTVRFTLDVDADLHLRMKLECVRQGKPMSVVLRDALEREFPATRSPI